MTQPQHPAAQNWTQQQPLTPNLAPTAASQGTAGTAQPQPPNQPPQLNSYTQKHPPAPQRYPGQPTSHNIGTGYLQPHFGTAAITRGPLTTSSTPGSQEPTVPPGLARTSTHGIRYTNPAQLASLFMTLVTCMIMPLAQSLTINPIQITPTLTYSYVPNLTPYDVIAHNITDFTINGILTGEPEVQGLQHLSFDWLTHNLNVVTHAIEDWLMYDTGAVTHVCPLNYATDYPLLPLDWSPPLRAASGHPLQLYGRRLVGYDFNGHLVHIMYYVTDVSYPITSGMRLADCGYIGYMHPTMPTITMPNDSCFPLTRNGTHIYMTPRRIPHY